MKWIAPGHDHNGGFVDVRPITRDQGGHAINRPTDLHESLKDCLGIFICRRSGTKYEAAAQRARQESSSYERYLLDLTERERETRRSKRIERLLRESRLFMEKSLSTLDLKRLPPKAAQQVRSLLEGGFVERHGECAHFRESRLWENACRVAIWPGTDPRGKEGDVRDLRSDGSGPLGREA